MLSGMYFIERNRIMFLNPCYSRTTGFTVNSLVLHFCHTHQNLVIKHIKPSIYGHCAHRNMFFFFISIKSSHTHVRVSLGILDSLVDHLKADDTHIYVTQFAHITRLVLPFKRTEFINKL